jgi:hypothetical protein
MRPTRRVSRRRHWKRRYDAQKTPGERLTIAFEYLRAMRAAGDRTIPAHTARVVDEIAQSVFDRADMLARQIPSTELEEKDNPRWNNRRRSQAVTR